MFWLFLELSTLCLVPCFFLELGYGSLTSLFSYLVASSLSSFFVVSGVVWEDLPGFIVLGLCIKFGLFPFLSWVYNVIEFSNWSVVWAFSTFLKSVFLFFPFFLSSDGCLVVSFMGGVSFLLLSGLFWVHSYSWKDCWCHMMLSSSVALVCMSLSISSDSLLWLFLIYILWSSGVVWYLSQQGEDYLSNNELLSGFFFVGLLVAYPLSISIFYKLVLGLCVYSCFFPVFLCWVFYNVSEQMYLLKFFIGSFSVRSEFSAEGLV